MTEVFLLLVAVALSLACGAFVAAEFSLTTVERGDLERAVERGERGAAGALKAVRQLTFQLSGAQLGITVTNLVVGMLAEPSISKLIAGPLEDIGVPPSASTSVALVLGTAVSTVFLMVVGELVPKNWAISAPLAMAKRVGTPQRWFSAAFRPFITHLNNTANHVVRRFGLEPAEELAHARGPQELVALARHSAKEGALEADTAELFVRTLNLADLTAENVMTPRVQVVALDLQATCEDVANATRATGLSRFPVYRESLDSVVGVAHIRDILAVPADQRPLRTLGQVIREPLFVPESLTVDRLLDRLSSGRQTMAVVIDEYGGTAGVATLEDIVEEVVGEVRDEHDPHETPDLAPVEARTTTAARGTTPTARPVWTSSRGWGCGRRTDRTRRSPAWWRPNSAGYRSRATASRSCGWRLDVVDATGRRAARVLLHAPLAEDAEAAAVAGRTRNDETAGRSGDRKNGEGGR